MDGKYTIVSLRDTDKYNASAAAWFHGRWGVPEHLYAESIAAAQAKKSAVPQWYVVLCGDGIVGGAGVIENDFHTRPDLTPNICALYVNKEHRLHGLARTLLDFICTDLAALGQTDAYLLTNHTDFYEKCGWEFHCMVRDDEGLSRMYHRSLK